MLLAKKASLVSGKSLNRLGESRMLEPLSPPVPAPVAPPVAPPISFSPVTPPSPFCNLCTSGGTTAASDSNVVIAVGSDTTCADVDSIVQGLASSSPSCQLVQATNLQIQCGCPLAPTQAPSPAPVSYPVCSVCQNEGEFITKLYDPITLPETTINPNILSQLYNCQNVEYYGSTNFIDPNGCDQLHQAGLSTMCGCQTFGIGPSTCEAASDLTLGESTYLRIANSTTTDFIVSDQPCTINSPSVWFRFEGTGGPLTLDVCDYFDYELQPKLSVFSGTGCDQRTCVGGNSDHDCRYTFSSEVGQTYFAAVGGYSGLLGKFKLMLTDQTKAPTTAPSAYPTAPTTAPFAFPTQAPFSTLSPAPTTSPTQSPTAIKHPVCNICKTSNERVSLPFVPIGSSTIYACNDVEYNGLTGRIEPGACSILKDLNLDEKCGCITPSGNDICDGATSISIGDTLNGTAAGSTWDDNLPCSDNEYYSTGVWFKFVGNGKPLKISSCESTEGYTYLATYSGSSCNDLSCVETHRDQCDNGNQLTLDSIKGRTYFVNVRGSGNFVLSLSEAKPPANDLCPNAATILSGERVYGNRTDATFETVPSCTDTSSALVQGVWYQFKSSAQPSRIVIQDRCNSFRLSQAGISVFSGSCGGLVCVAGNQHYCSNKGRVVWESDQETTYWIFVYATASSLIENDFNLELTEVAATPTSSPAPSEIPFIPAAPIPFPLSAPVSSPIPPAPVGSITPAEATSSPPPSTSPLSYSYATKSPTYQHLRPTYTPRSKKSKSRKSASMQRGNDKKGGKSKNSGGEY